MVLLGSSAAISDVIEFKNCYTAPGQQVIRYEKSDWTINTSSNLVSHLEVYQDSFLEKINKLPEYQFSPLQKENFTDYEIYNYTSEIVIANKYYSDHSLRQLLLYPNDRVIHWQARIDFKKNRVKVIMLPKGHEVYDFNKVKRLYSGNYTYTQFTKDFKTRTKIYQCSSSTGGSDNKEGGSSGTAFFVSNKGHLLTNNHVVEGCSVSKITYQNKEYETQLLAKDKTLDLALLKVQLKPKSFINFSKNGAKKLNKIYVAGYPLGKGLSDDLKISSGIVSSLKGFEDNSNEIQIDAPINPGNSGGPIINENGDLVAIAVSGLAKDQTEGINFGIKSSSAELFLKSNNVKPKKSLYSRSKNNEDLLKILEEGTVYTFCN